MEKRVLYFSAEWGLSNRNIPIYAGGLGILAGDALLEAHRMGWPWTGMGLMYREGFFEQKIDATGTQTERHHRLCPEDYGLKLVHSRPQHPLLISVPFPGRQIFLQIWQLKIDGTSLYLLDADLPDNKPEDRRLTSRLYTGNWNLQLAQEVLLGVGGVEAARVLNLEINLWHLNDDHAGFSLLWRLKGVHSSLDTEEDVAAAVAEVRRNSVFTTHTPIKGAESVSDRTALMPYLQALFGVNSCENIFKIGQFTDATTGAPLFSLTVAAMKLTRARNAVSQRHNEVAKKIWGFIWPEATVDNVPIRAVTNGVNPSSWISAPMDKLFKKYLAVDWRDNVDSHDLWQKALSIPDKDLWRAHLTSKKALLGYLGKHYHHLFKTTPTVEPLFLGFARRFAAYKQPGVLLNDLTHLRKILLNPDRPAYLFLSGKANPIDPVGKELVKKAVAIDKDPELGEHIIFLPDYDMEIAKYLISGVDLWINTPLPPWEACGTSGMKAIYNGVLNASTYDGWWYEAYDPMVGFVIGPDSVEAAARLDETTTSDALFYLLENDIVPLYYDRTAGLPTEWLNRVRNSLVKLAPRYNSCRMLKEYRDKIYG